MKFKQAIDSAFFNPQRFKGNYMTAKGDEVNPYNLMRFIEVSLVMLNPIMPHFS